MTEEPRPRRPRRRPFSPTRRDDHLCGTLYAVEQATAEQLAGRWWPEAGSVYFPTLEKGASEPGGRGGPRDDLDRMQPSPESCARRLRILRSNRFLVSREHEGRTVWMLSRSAFRREADDLRRYDEPYPGWLKGRTQHLLDTNDLYFGIAGELDEILGGGAGPDPASWTWLSERRAFDRYPAPGAGATRRIRVHQPDAEILFADRLFVVERQTARARETREAIRAKLERHRERATHLAARARHGEGPALRPCLLFACDEARDARYALEEARTLPGCPETFAGSLEAAAAHVVEAAQEEERARRQERPDHEEEEETA
jgi:hypothetical protein